MDFLKRKKCYKDAVGLEGCLKELDRQVGDNNDDISSSSDEDEVYDKESEDPAEIHIGDDIVLSDVTDNAEESDNEVTALGDIQSSKRRKQSAVIFKKNVSRICKKWFYTG